MRFSRRSFVKISGSFLISIGTGMFIHNRALSATYSDKDAADRWLNQWMESLNAATGALHLGRFADRMYFLTEEILWTPNLGQQAPSVQVPMGFVTDFATIPRVFWSFLPPDGLYTYPAIIHDYLYWEQPVSRDMADLIFRYSMEDFNIGPTIINMIYSAVRLGGGAAWRDNTARKQSGERRILRVFPTDPTVRWVVYKFQPDVFLE